MKHLVDSLVRHLNYLALLAGAVLAAVGAGMIYLPAGLLAGGILTMVGAVLSIWGEGGEK